MSESKFKVGDVVVLKSGGPAMTVGFITEKGGIRCTWFPRGDYAKTTWEEFNGATLMSEEEAEALLEDGDEDDEVTQ